MKKVFAILLTLAMVLSLAACGEPEETKGAESSSTPPKASGDVSDSQPSVNWEDVEDAFDKLETLKPEGWDENGYGMYIYDVWDAEFLPDIFPAQVEGTKVSQTNFKDYKHDVLNSNYAVGPIWYDAPENYREYSVSFYATTDQLDQYIASARAGGFTGGETSSPDDEWREFSFYHADGWLMYIFFNTRDDDDGSFDGCASVSLTDSLFERPASIAGVQLPDVGAAAYDYMAGSCYEVYEYATGNMESMDVEWEGSFPNNDEYSWWIYFTYYGADLNAAKAYKDSLASDGWEVLRERNEEEGEYRCTLYNGTVYMVVNCYNNTQLEIGFADMEENLSY